ncbi:protein DMP2-like [Elaeis guineensis]|uniref:Protein DMP2-like n=1 Tax=Elaeis guineensis var. tenera TaxID=51953 RepID=A0A6I9S7H0_ELAGV|nr:protein DMP2-like [Elaeis guineensis]
MDLDYIDTKTTNSMAKNYQQSSKKMNSVSKSFRSSAQTIGDRAFKGVADLMKLLPSGTVFLFQFLNPLLTNAGHCHTVNKYLSGALLAICGFSCCFSSFSDSYIGSDGKVYHGLVTKDGLWSFSDPNASSKVLSKYKLRYGDFVHAFLSLIVLAVIALLDGNIVSCFYPSFESEEKTLLMVLPTVVGGLASSAFMIFFNNRHGIGNAPTGITEKSD